MDDTDALMGIGAFARRVGLAPSALRFYDDCDVLRPAHVDDATGYRYYEPEQEARAVLVRRLREAGMPLTEASAVLDGTREEARACLEAHARRSQEAAETTRSAIQDLLREVTGGEARGEAEIGGAEFAAAVRQVAPAAAPVTEREEFPVLGAVLIELEHQELRLVATDRYRLAVRALRLASALGAPRRALVAVPDLEDAASWAKGLVDVTVEMDDRGVRLRGDGAVRELGCVEGTFPDYRTVLDGLPKAGQRIVADRAALRAAILGARADGPVTLSADGRRLTLVLPGSATTTLDAVCLGGAVRVLFDPAVLLPALDAGVGPDVLLELTSPDEPVVVRSADQGSFTTLVMPVRDGGCGVRSTA
ncbi:DNA polymerase III subunit beta family protein [Streptomyces montanisoli]|uniref:MerR family transcriptional regulator n=1 Tax=Streptomyces montanisoli TaxID=2798581 RepID=A0A940M9K9_9ACTN|nr:MerR family transcriptional regulator [Streptomyces montanisoli]MBP0457294.1 MerR family transcriptional regulator [Streptomyces montanisoli]